MYSIYKISIGRYYYILKTTSIGWFNDRVLKPYVDNVEDKPVHPLYQLLLDKVTANSQDKKPKPIKTETIVENVSGYKAVLKEFELLQKGFGKKTCLNTNQYPYLPQTRATKSKLQNHTTFTEADRANYIKFLKKKGIDWHTIYPATVSFRERVKNTKN